MQPTSCRCVSQLIERLLDHLKELDRQVDELEAQIKAWHRGSELSRKLEKIPGIGPLTASALVASIADAQQLRQRPAVVGLAGAGAPAGLQWRQAELLGISKRGDVYLRTLLIHGARSAILAAQRKAVNTTPGWPSCSTAAIRTLRPSRWPTRTRARSGRCLHTAESSEPTTRPSLAAA